MKTNNIGSDNNKKAILSDYIRSQITLFNVSSYIMDVPKTINKTKTVVKSSNTDAPDIEVESNVTAILVKEPNSTQVRKLIPVALPPRTSSTNANANKGGKTTAKEKKPTKEQIMEEMNNKKNTFHKDVLKELDELDSDGKLPKFGEVKMKTIHIEYMDMVEKLYNANIRTFTSVISIYSKEVLDKEQFTAFMVEFRSVFGLVGRGSFNVYIRVPDVKKISDQKYFHFSCTKELPLSAFNSGEGSNTLRVNFGNKEAPIIEEISIAEIINIYCKKGKYAYYQIAQMLPGDNTAYMLNLWVGFQLPIIVDSDGDPIKPGVYKGRRGKEYNTLPDEDIISLLKDIIAAKQKDPYKYLKRLYSLMVQYPGIMTRVCPIIIGDHGVGKNTWYDILVKFIFSEYSCTVKHMEQLTGKFNAVTANKTFVLCNEISSEKGKYSVNVNSFKGLITESDGILEKKGKDGETMTSSINLTMLSNSHLPIVLEDHDRRCPVFEADDYRRKQTAFWKRVYSKINLTQAILVYNWLMSTDLTGFNPTEFPDTEARERLINNSNPIRSFIFALDWRKLVKLTDSLSINQFYQMYKLYSRAYHPNTKLHSIDKFKDVVAKSDLVEINYEGSKSNVMVSEDLIYNGEFWLDDEYGKIIGVCVDAEDKYEDDDNKSQKSVTSSTSSKMIMAKTELDSELDAFINQLEELLPDLHVEYENQIKAKRRRVPYKGCVPFAMIMKYYKQQYQGKSNQTKVYASLKNNFNENNNSRRYVVKGGDSGWFLALRESKVLSNGAGRVLSNNSDRVLSSGTGRVTSNNTNRSDSMFSGDEELELEF